MAKPAAPAAKATVPEAEAADDVAEPAVPEVSISREIQQLVANNVKVGEVPAGFTGLAKDGQATISDRIIGEDRYRTAVHETGHLRLDQLSPGEKAELNNTMVAGNIDIFIDSVLLKYEYYQQFTREELRDEFWTYLVESAGTDIVQAQTRPLTVIMQPFGFTVTISPQDYSIMAKYGLVEIPRAVVQDSSSRFVDAGVHTGLATGPESVDFPYFYNEIGTARANSFNVSVNVIRYGDVYGFSPDVIAQMIKFHETSRSGALQGVVFRYNGQDVVSGTEFTDMNIGFDWLHSSLPGGTWLSGEELGIERFKEAVGIDPEITIVNFNFVGSFWPDDGFRDPSDRKGAGDVAPTDLPEAVPEPMIEERPIDMLEST